MTNSNNEIKVEENQIASAVINVDNNINKNFDNVSQRHSKFMKLLYDLCNICGYQIEGRIKLRDRKSGRLFE